MKFRTFRHGEGGWLPATQGERYVSESQDDRDSGEIHKEKKENAEWEDGGT